MNPAYWHPVCPSCRHGVSSIAFPGDERGPYPPAQYPMLANVFCQNPDCAQVVHIEACNAWLAERIWNVPDPDATDLHWRVLSIPPPGSFSY